MHLLLRWIVLSLAVGISAYLLPGVIVQSVGVAIMAALVIALINAVVRPILLLLTLPINLLSLGLFTFVINALMILLAAKVVDGFTVDHFWWALLFSLMLSVTASILSKLLK